MLTVCRPSVAHIRERLAADGAHYWSAATEAVLRSLGIVSITTEIVDGATTVLTRSTPLHQLTDAARNGSLVIEAPLHPEVASWLRVGEIADLTDQLDVDGETVARQRIWVRGPDRELTPALDDSSPWSSGPIPVLRLDPSWETIVEAEVGGIRRPLVARRGPVLLLTAPLLDVLAQWCSFPPLGARFARSEGALPLRTAERLADVIRAHHLDHGSTPLVTARRFPEPFHAALTLRADLDREVSDEEVADLIDLLGSTGVRCSMGVLDYLRPDEQLAQLLDAGVEIQIHAFAEDQPTFDQHLRRLEETIGVEVTGVTTHGGPAGIGYRGDHHFGIFRNAGLRVGELIGLHHQGPTAVVRPLAGVPTWSPDLLAPTRHLSMDGSTRPDDHRLDDLAREVPRRLADGMHVVVMNHPDIHRPELRTLLEGLDLNGVWSATIEEIAAYTRTALFASQVTVDGSTTRLRVDRPATEDIAFDVTVPGQATERHILLAGDRALSFTGTDPRRTPMPALAYFTTDARLTDEKAAELRDLPGAADARIWTFSRASREYAFPLTEDATGHLFCPLPLRAFDHVVIDRRCDFLDTSMTADWVREMMRSLRPGGSLLIPFLPPEREDTLNRYSAEQVARHLGVTGSRSGAYLAFVRPDTWEAPPIRSVLGSYLEGRGDFVLNAVTGDAVRVAEPIRLRTLVGPDVLDDEAPTLNMARIDRTKIVDIVQQVRAGTLTGKMPGVAPEPVEPQAFAESARSVQMHIGSWQNYVMFGTYYKAATLRKVLRSHFGGRDGLRLIEHGGYAGSLSMQLLLEDGLGLATARCNEVDPKVLLNTELMLKRLDEHVGDRFSFSVGPTEGHRYDASYDAIAFVHMLLYVRRDMIDDVLADAAAALRPGGALVVLENTKPPTQPGGNDDDIIFEPDELDRYLERIGSIDYYAVKTGEPVDAAEKAKTATVRIVTPR